MAPPIVSLHVDKKLKKFAPKVRGVVAAVQPIAVLDQNQNESTAADESVAKSTATSGLLEDLNVQKRARLASLTNPVTDEISRPAVTGSVASPIKSPVKEQKENSAPKPAKISIPLFSTSSSSSSSNNIISSKASTSREVKRSSSDNNNSNETSISSPQSNSGDQTVPIESRPMSYFTQVPYKRKDQEEPVKASSLTAAKEDPLPPAPAPSAPAPAVAPQIMLVNGKVMLDQESVQISQSVLADNGQTPLQVVEETGELINSASFSRPRVRSDRWSPTEDRKFFEALAICGTDFSMIAQVLPGRSRAQIKNKYKREERLRPECVKQALCPKKPIAADVINRLLSPVETTPPVIMGEAAEPSPSE